MVDAIWINELDDHNDSIRRQTQNGFSKLRHKEDLENAIALWNQVQAGTQLLPAASGAGKDSVYTVERVITDDGEIETERFRGLLTYIRIDGRPYQLTIETNVEEADETVLAISLITGLFIALLITGFILLNRWLSTRIWAPFSDTLEKLKRFDLSSSDAITFKTTDITEFVELNSALAKLIDNNLSAYRQQKEFTQNASHELQTPLALLTSKIDLLIQDPSLTPEQRVIIESLDASVSRVSRINKNLLLLAGIENREYKPERVNLSAQLLSILDLFKAFSEKNRIQASIAPDIFILANESLIEILITNLLSNAFRHGTDDNLVTVILNEKILTVSNSGSASLKNEFLFRRFMSASTQNPGTGLGLAIVKEICDKYGWHVSYHFTNAEHVFSLSF
jgi:signal transduction histidine kinase